MKKKELKKQIEDLKRQVESREEDIRKIIQEKDFQTIFRWQLRLGVKKQVEMIVWSGEHHDTMQNCPSEGKEL